MTQRTLFAKTSDRAQTSGGFWVDATLSGKKFYVNLGQAQCTTTVLKSLKLTGEARRADTVMELRKILAVIRRVGDSKHSLREDVRPRADARRVLGRCHAVWGERGAMQAKKL